MKLVLKTFIIVLCLITLGISTSFADTIVKKGTIKGQSVKWTTGSVTIVKTANGHELKLGNNFKTKKGPALFVYLGNDGPKKKIGRLKSIEGSQSYKIPSSINPGEFSKVYIYCVPFRAIFGVGTLR